jgi:hypothetical protein
MVFRIEGAAVVWLVTKKVSNVGLYHSCLSLGFLTPIRDNDIVTY